MEAPDFFVEDLLDLPNGDEMMADAFFHSSAAANSGATADHKDKLRTTISSSMSSTASTSPSSSPGAGKAIAWSPYLHGLLASGGSTADHCIRLWNTSTKAHLGCMDIGSQLANL